MLSIEREAKLQMCICDRTTPVYCCGQRLCVYILHNGAGHAPKIAPSLGRDPGPQPIHGSFESKTKTASRSVKPFFQGSRLCPTDRQTDRSRYTDSNKPHLMLCTAMRHNNKPTNTSKQNRRVGENNSQSRNMSVLGYYVG